MSTRVSDLRGALQRTAALLTTNPTEADLRLTRLLADHPGQPNIRALLAAAKRNAGHPDSAIELLETLISEHPDYPLAHQELGLTLRETGDIELAEASLSKAVELAPDLRPAWRALAELRARQGNQDGSELAYQNYVSVTAGDPELLQAANLLFAGKLGQAEKICRDFLMDHPTNPSAIRMLADIGIKLGRIGDAEKLLERCLELAPDFHLARANYANVLSKRLRYEEALQEIDRVIAAEPDNPSHDLLRASILVRIGDHQAAIGIYEEILAQYPEQPRTLVSLGHALKTVGRQEEAIAAYRAGVAKQPALGEAYWSLANLKTFHFEDTEVATMEAQATTPNHKAEDYYNLFFALGKAHEDRGDWDLAFQSYAKGNALRRRTVRWDAEENHRSSGALIDFFTSDFFEARKGWGCPDDSPIFIVGLPRAGSTLLEQILASHSNVEGTMELPDIISIARRLSGRRERNQPSRYPAILSEITEPQARALGEEYLARTIVHRSDTPRFIDKMPNNFSHVGLIRLILPNAAIIDARRHPLACCFSGLKQLFANGQNFTYDLTDIDRY
jgi:tetratricopeptide (TPR) repeat protein